MVTKNNEKYNPEKTLVYFIRHGEKIEIPGDKRLGGITKKGISQARDVGRRLKKLKIKIDVLYCSSMQRSIETANEISKFINKKPIICNELSEFNTILWTREYHKPKYWRNFKHYVKSRIAFRKILKKHEGKVIVIVAHGNIIRGLIGSKIKLKLKSMGRLDCSNCHVSLVRFKGTKLDYIYYINNKGPLCIHY